MSTDLYDILRILGGQFGLTTGLLSVLIALVRMKGQDYSLLTFGLFSFIYSLRWLLEVPAIASLGFPLSSPYLHTLLTYVVAIPFSAYLVQVFGRGFYDSLLWVYRSSVIYAAGATAYDIFWTGDLGAGAINSLLVLVWTTIGIVNLILLKGPGQIERRVVQFGFGLLLVSITFSNLASLGVLAQSARFEGFDFLVLLGCLGFVAVRRFVLSESRLAGIERELALARQIQRSNLPQHSSSGPGPTIAARYLPMTEVAGDFYDIHRTTDGGTAILLADVSGHGIGAALIGSMLKIAFASQTEHAADPARVLTNINRVLQDKMEGSFITGCALYIEPSRERIRYANAGHPPPMLRKRADGSIIRLSLAGTILGPFGNVQYENAELRIETGDRLLLFTDGISEAKNRDGELLGDDRLENVLRNADGKDAEAAADMIVKEVMQWSGRTGEGALDDDVTFLVVDV